MNKVITASAAAAVVVMLSACSSKGTSGLTASAVPTPSSSDQASATKSWADLTVQDTLPITDLDSCLSVIYSFKQKYPTAVLTAVLDPEGYAKAKASSNSFDLIDLEKATQPKIDALFQRLNPRKLAFVSIDATDEAKDVRQYHTEYNTDGPMGFSVVSDYTMGSEVPSFSKNGAVPQCYVGPAQAGDQGRTDFVGVSDTTLARHINDLIIKHQVHPRYLFALDGWGINGQGDVYVTADIAKTQLISHDGKVLAEATFKPGRPTL